MQEKYPGYASRNSVLKFFRCVAAEQDNNNNENSDSSHFYQCTELLGYTQLTQCIDKSRFISSLAFRCYISLSTSCLVLLKNPVRLQALSLHQSILRLRNVTSGKNYGHEIPVTLP